MHVNPRNEYTRFQILVYITAIRKKNAPLLLDNNRKEEIRVKNVLSLRACVYLSVRVCALIWRGEDVAVIFSCPRVSPGTQTQVSRFGGMHLSLLNHLASLGTLRRLVRPLISTRDQGGGQATLSSAQISYQRLVSVNLSRTLLTFMLR